MKLNPAILALTLSLVSSSLFANWTSCYNKKENKVYFTPYDKALVSSNKENLRCLSNTFFTGLKNHHMLIEPLDEKGFPTGEAGGEMIIKLDSGRQLMISQWNDLSKANKLMVLEPNFKTKQVKLHCTIYNFNEAFSAKVDPKTGVLKVLVLTTTKKQPEKIIKLWKSCKI